MTDLRYTLVSDGPTDRALIPILDFLLRENGVPVIQSAWADLRRLREQPRNLTEKIELGLQLYPCDLLFIHRDAEREEPSHRYDEVASALLKTKVELSLPTVCVIPRRMTEAWLLIEEQAIRQAADNPNGKAGLIPLAYDCAACHLGVILWACTANWFRCLGLMGTMWRL